MIKKISHYHHIEPLPILPRMWGQLWRNHQKPILGSDPCTRIIGFSQIVAKEWGNETLPHPSKRIFHTCVERQRNQRTQFCVGWNSFPGCRGELSGALLSANSSRLLPRVQGGTTKSGFLAFYVYLSCGEFSHFKRPSLSSFILFPRSSIWIVFHPSMAAALEIALYGGDSVLQNSILSFDPSHWIADAWLPLSFPGEKCQNDSFKFHAVIWPLGVGFIAVPIRF